MKPRQKRPVRNLEAVGHEHLSLPMLLWGLVGGAAQSAGRWLMTHYGLPLLTRYRKPWDNSAPAAKAVSSGKHDA